MSVVSMRFTVAGRILAGIILLGPNLSGQEIASALGLTSQFNIQAQTACEAEMLGKAGAREVSSGKAYDELTRSRGRMVGQFRTSISFPEVGTWPISLPAVL